MSVKPTLFAAASIVGRYVPPGVGDIRFAQLAYERTPRPDASIRVLKGGARMILDPSEWPQAQAWVLGRYDPSTVRFILDRLPDVGGVFLDVGAHVGLISFQVAMQRPSVRIYGFEPHPRVATAYRRNAELNGVDATLTEVAASDRDGFVTFDLNSHSIGEGEGTVPTLRLDDYIAAQNIECIDVMKLDVEGHELKALEGARDTLETGKIRAITLETMEAHGDTRGPAELLRAHGYHQVPLASTAMAAVTRKLRPERIAPNTAYVRPARRAHL